MTVDNMYSITVTSKFKLFYEDVEEGEDPNEMLSRLEAEAKLKSKVKTDKVEKKKSSKDAAKKPEAKEAIAVRNEKPADKKGKRSEKKDEKPPRFANRQNRDSDNGKRDDREGDAKENSGPTRGRGGYRGDRGGNRGGYRGRGGGFRGGRDGQAPRPNGHGPNDEWNVQGDAVPGDSWGGPTTENENERRTEDRNFRGGGRGQGGYGRGGSYGGLNNRGGGFRGGRGGPRGGFRREYERHSGSFKTGVKPIEKRDGAGAHNWGTMKDDLDASGNEISDGPTVEWTNKETTVPAGGQTEAVDEGAAISTTVEENVDEDTSANPESNTPVIMTLDEYRAQQAKKKAEVNESLKISDATRKINDGQDAFKNMVRYQKERIVDDDEDEEDEDDEDEDDEDLHRSKQIVIDVRFSDAPRRGGGRFTNERGTGRGGRGGVGDRGRGSSGFRGGRGGSFRGSIDRAETRQYSGERPRSQQAQIRLNDENDFPSLK